MAITIHPARRSTAEDGVLPGTWEGTKQDAVLATAQLLEVLSRKKVGERAYFGESEYDAQMANAQLRAFKLTKVIIRDARRNSQSADVPIKIEDLGFQVDANSNKPHQIHASEYVAPPAPPPTIPLPTPPRTKRPRSARSKSSSPPTQKVKPNTPPPVTRFPPPVPAKKSTHRLSHVAPLATVHSRHYSDELSPKSIPAPLSPSRPTRPGSPIPVHPASPSRDLCSNPKENDLPVQPFRRGTSESSKAMNSPQERLRTPVPARKPSLPHRSPLRGSVYGEPKAPTAPLSPISPLAPKKRASLQRSLSFRFGDGLQSARLSRSSSLLYSELSEALNDLQRTIGVATSVEVH
jgi:hypothetical protein